MAALRDFFQKDTKSASQTASPDALYRSAFSTFQQLGQSGIVVPKSIAEPLIAAQAVGDVTSITAPQKERLLSAIHRLDSTYKYWTDLRRKYTRNFYIVLAALLFLQLYYAAASDIFKNLSDVQASLNRITDADKVKDENALGRDLLVAQRRIYIYAGEYVNGIIDAVVWRLPLFGGDHPNASYKQEKDDAARAETILIQLRLITSFLGAFMLPLLYGMLGAVAYILRRISQAADDDDLRSLRRRLDLRLPIGALSGLAAGWLLQPSSIPGSTISPFALAFVAGYAAELVFAAMDRIVAAFSGQPAAEQAQAQGGASGKPGSAPSGPGRAGQVDPPDIANAPDGESPVPPAHAGDSRQVGAGSSAPLDANVSATITPMSRAAANDQKVEVVDGRI